MMTGTVTDHERGLMWAGSDNHGDIDWRSAQLYCRLGPPSLLGRYHNWRMPTLDELASLYIREESYEGYETDCGHKVGITPEIRLTCGWVWSGETRAITARSVQFSPGGIPIPIAWSVRQHYRALPVRDLTSDPE